MPGVPFTCVSMGVVIVCSTVCASAPLYRVVILTVGGLMSGYWLTGKFKMDKTPTKTITMEITMAVTGLFIKLSAIIVIFRLLHSLLNYLSIVESPRLLFCHLQSAPAVQQLYH